MAVLLAVQRHLGEDKGNTIRFRKDAPFDWLVLEPVYGGGGIAAIDQACATAISIARSILGEVHATVLLAAIREVDVPHIVRGRDTVDIVPV